MISISLNDSSAIKKMDWDDGELTVEFTTGSHYRYEGVPIKDVSDVIRAESVGNAFYRIIKMGNYPYVRLIAG